MGGVAVAAAGTLRVGAQEATTAPWAISSSAAATPGVSVPDSPAAVDLLDKAVAKEQQQQWPAAADLYQQAIQKYAARAVPVQLDANTNTFRYTGVATAVMDRIARWPAEALASYQSSFGPAAADALAGANARAGSPDLAALDRVFTTAFVTDAGKAAGVELLDALFQSGRFDEAAAVGDRLLAVHPSLTVERPAILFRTAACRYRAGEVTAAKSLLEQLRRQFPQAAGTVAGKDVVLPDALATLLASPPPAPHPDASDADTWPTFTGSPDHAGISSSLAKAGASITRFELIPPVDPAHRPAAATPEDDGPSQGEGIGIMPVADGHAMFFQDGRHVYAVDLTTGRPLPGWLETYPPGPAAAGSDEGGVYTLNLAGRPRGEQLTTTASADAVLAVMGQPDHSPFVPGQAVTFAVPSSPRVVCLDRTTGRLRWSLTAADLPAAAGKVHDADFSGPVRVVASDVAADSVLVCAIGGREHQFAECYLVGLSLKTGKYQWSTYLGSATQSFDGDTTTETPLAPQLSVDGTTAYVLSNVGTVAAVDVAGGMLRWLSAYPRDGVDAGDPNFFRARLQGIAPSAAPKPWAFNPPIIRGGRVYVLPADGKSLRVFDAATGEERRRVATSDLDDADVLLGVEPPSADAPAGVVLTSAKGIYCIDPDTFAPAEPTTGTLAAGILWQRNDVAADTQHGDENTLFGRGFLTADSAFLPTRHRLYQLSTRTGGKVVAMIPSSGVWGSVGENAGTAAGGSNEPGNVLATADNVIVAGAHGIDVYADLDRVRRHFAELIAAAPTDPAPRVALADALFNAGDSQTALQTLDEAIALARGSNADPSAPLPAGDAQRSILNEALTFARRSAALAIPTDADSDAGDTTHPGDEAMSTLADALFDRAAVAAASPAEHVSYLLARARFDHDRKDLRAEVMLCQQILSDRATRSIAGDDAAAEIADAVGIDASAYEPVQQQAMAALTTAQAGGDPAQLLELSATYPNSSAATTALETAATLDESRGDNPAAIAALRSAFGGPGFSADAAEANARKLARMARDFAATPGGGPATVDRLCAALRWQPNLILTDELPLPGGGTLSAGTPAASAVATLRTILSQREESALPTLHVATTPAWATPDLSSPDELRIDHVASLLLPQSTASPTTAGRSDRIVATTGDGLAVFEPGKIAPRWTASLPAGPVLGSAWLGDALAVWTGSGLHLWNDAAAGAALPVTDAASLPGDSTVVALDPVTDNLPDDVNDAPVPPPLVPGGRRIGIRRPVRVVNGMVIGGGFVAPVNFVPNPQAAAAGAGPVQFANAVIAGERLVIGTSNGQLAAVDPTSGAVVWRTRVETRAADHLLANPHFVVARFDDPNSSEVMLLDALTGKLLGTRRFGTAGTPGQLVDVALSEEGTLAITLNGRLLTKDLYEPWKLPPVELVGGPDSAGPASFAGMTGERQLLMHHGRVLALYDAGAFLRVHDLSARNATAAAADGTPPAESEPLSTGSTTPAVALYPVGSRVYALTSTSFAQYNLAFSGDHYLADPYDMDIPPRLQDLLIGQDYAVAINQPRASMPLSALPPTALPANLPAGKPVPAGQALSLLLAYSRSPVSAANPRESGKLDFAPTRRDAAGVTAWQALDGGFAFLTGDQTLHVLLPPRAAPQ